MSTWMILRWARRRRARRSRFVLIIDRGRRDSPKMRLCRQRAWRGRRFGAKAAGYGAGQAERNPDRGRGAWPAASPRSPWRATAPKCRC